MLFVVLILTISLVQLLCCWLSFCQLQIDQLSFDCMTVQSCALIGGVLLKTENAKTQRFSQKGDLKVLAYFGYIQSRACV